MGLNLNYLKGQTPIDEDDKDGLKIKTISTKGELDEFEQNNIEKAIEWSLSRKYQYQDILSIEFTKLLHKKMFSDVWEWTGCFRKTNKNIGVDKSNIQAELKALNDDCILWIEEEIYEPDEIAIRYSHRMVSIHPFPNGNGRHSRLYADIIISHVFDQAVFTWGRTKPGTNKDIRKEYLQSIYKADDGNIAPLLNFARG